MDELCELTKIKHWFIEQMKELVEEEEASFISRQRRPDAACRPSFGQAKRDGFSDRYLSTDSASVPEEEVRTSPA